MGSPQVSVVMSVYNGSRYLGPSIESILGQEGVDFEFIIVDDGSTDGSPEILETYSGKDSRIRIVNQENQGLTRSLINGCALARGVYIARQDADDLSRPGRLKQMLNMMESCPDVVLCGTGTSFVAPDGEITGEYFPEGDIEEITKRLREDLIGVPSHGSVMFRKESYQKVGGYRPQFYYSQDVDLWLRLVSIGKFACVKKYLYVFRESENSISSRGRFFQQEFCRLAQMCYRERIKGNDEMPFLVQAKQLCTKAIMVKNGSCSNSNASLTYRIIAARLKQRGNTNAARKYLIRAFKRNPWALKVWKDLLLLGA